MGDANGTMPRVSAAVKHGSRYWRPLINRASWRQKNHKSACYLTMKRPLASIAESDSVMPIIAYYGPAIFWRYEPRLLRLPIMNCWCNSRPFMRLVYAVNVAVLYLMRRVNEELRRFRHEHAILYQRGCAFAASPHDVADAIISTGRSPLCSRCRMLFTLRRWWWPKCHDAIIIIADGRSCVEFQSFGGHVRRRAIFIWLHIACQLAYTASTLPR